MAEKKAGIIVILSSPSGAGKTTLVKKISSRNNYNISISHTTRKPRANEKNGQDYFFINNQRFKNLIKKKKFLEHAKVFKNYYGSLKETVINNLNGFLVPKKDYFKAALSMKSLLDHDLREKMGNESRKYCESKYNVHNVNDSLFDEMGLN